MSYMFPDYPHTGFYDGEVGFLIKEYKHLVDEYDKIYNKYNLLYKEFAEIEKEFKTFKPYIDNEFSKFKKEFSDSLDLFEKTMNEELNNFKNSILQRVDGIEQEMDEFEKRMNENYRNFSYQITTQINDLRKYLQDWQLAFENILEIRLNGFDNYMKIYVEIEFKKCMKEMREILNQWVDDFPPVRNPINGQLEGINEVLEQIWRIHVRGITVNQLIESMWTVNSLVEQKLTVMDIVTKGYDLLYWKQPWKMYSPFNGRYVPITEVIYELANLHKIPITIDRLIAYKKTVYEIVSWNETVENFIWKGGIIFAENS